jgi:hypothetical protein
MPPQVLKTILGHSKLSTTMDIQPCFSQYKGNRISENHKFLTRYHPDFEGSFSLEKHDKIRKSKQPTTPLQWVVAKKGRLIKRDSVMFCQSPFCL